MTSQDSQLTNSYSRHTIHDSRVSSPDIVIGVKNLSKKYRRYGSVADAFKEVIHPFRKKYHDEFWALKDVSFEIKKGESVGIIGRNGSGKSTLLQILCGILQPTSGEVSVTGRVSALLELGAGFHPQFTGRENVYLNGAILGLTKEEIDKRFDAIADFADIGDFIDQPVKTYSSGMFVRLAFACNVHVEPDILIVDEALAVGDIAFQQKCIAKLNSLMEKKITLIFVTHDIQMIKNLCNTALYLRNGHVLCKDDTETVSEAYLKDVFDSQQQKEKDGKDKVSWKKTNLGFSSFGTQSADVLDLAMLKEGKATDTICQGDTVTVKVVARFNQSVKNPVIVLQLRDFRAYQIYGIDTLTAGHIFTDEERKYGAVGASFTFDVNLAPGDYAFAIGLNDQITDTLVVLHEKMVGALPFKVLQKFKKFHGVIDMKASCEKINLETEATKRSSLKHTEPGWGDNDIGEEGLNWAIGHSEAPELLQSLVDISRGFFGWFTKHKPRAFEYPWIIKEIGDPSAKRIMDIGAGVSPLPLVLAEKGAEVITVDHSPIVRLYDRGQTDMNEWGFLDYKQFNKGVSSFNEDILKVKFDDGSLDCIYSVSVIEHMPAGVRRQIWEKASGWLKPGGLLLLTIDLVPGTEKLWNYSEGQKVEDERAHGSFEDLEKELNLAGFVLSNKHFLRDIPESRVDIVMLRCVKKEHRS